MAEKYTFSDYKDAVKLAAKNHPEWRAGQAAFNVLVVNRPDLSERIRATDVDPFHNARCLPRFYEWVEENWNQRNRNQ